VLVHTNKMFEYMALQRPVIMSRLDAVAAYMTDDAALYFDSGNHQELAEKIVEIARDPGAAEARVQRANELYRKQRWENEKREYLGRYAG